MAAAGPVLVDVPAPAMRTPQGKTALVTGANRGIGLEYCRQLQARGDQVVAVCREPSPELAALGVRIESAVELTDAAAMAALVQRLWTWSFSMPEFCVPWGCPIWTWRRSVSSSR